MVALVEAETDMEVVAAEEMGVVALVVAVRVAVAEEQEEEEELLEAEVAS